MRVSLLSLILFLVLQQLKAQAPMFVPGKIVGVQVHFPYDIALDSDENIYLADAYGITRFDQEGNVDLNYKQDNLNWQNFGSFNIALDQQNNLYVIGYSYSKIAKFSPEGHLLLEFGSDGTAPGQLKNPQSIVVDKEGNIYIADTGNQRVQKFSATGALLKVIPIHPVDQSNMTELVDIALDSNGNIYVIDSYYHHHNVLKYSPEGRLLVDFNMQNTSKNLLSRPSDIIIAPSGIIYVSDADLHKIVVFNTDGVYQREIQHPHGLGYLDGTKISLALDKSGNLYAADRRHHGDSHVLKFDSNGKVIKKWGDQYRTLEFTMDEAGNVYLLAENSKIIKFDPAGQPTTFLWDSLSNYAVGSATAIALDIQGNIYVPVAYPSPAILKFSNTGRLISRFQDFGIDTRGMEIIDLTVDIAGYMYAIEKYGGSVLKISPTGVFQQKVGAGGGEPGQLWAPKAVSVDIRGNLFVLDYNGGRIQKFDPAGKFLTQFGKFSENDITLSSDSDMDVDGRGNVYVASNLYKNYFWIYDNNGNLLHEEEKSIQHLSIDKKASRLIMSDGHSDAYTIYYSTSYKPAEGFISGIVYRDLNQNCLQEENEKGLAGVVVEAMPGQYYGITDENGSYTIEADTGSYFLRQILPQEISRTITQVCPTQTAEQKVKVATRGSTVKGPNFGNRVVEKPFLSVNISSDRRRRCFPGTTTVIYSNSGFATAPNAKVYLQLPEYVVLKAANKPYSQQANGTYVFDVGDVVAGQHSVISIQDSVKCGDESIRGLTVCTKAWITPANHYTDSPHARTQVTGACNYEKGAVRFVIRNNGQSDMEAYKSFRVYTDGALAMIEQYKLASGDSLVLWIPAMGKTVRLDASQPDGNGDNILASATVEACRIAVTRTAFSTGFVNALPTDDEEAEVAEECLPIIDSFDPNDKLVLPTGRTEENYTPTGAALKYKIRFQNTGTDVAYRVVVVDTLSEHLDLSTLQIGSASHAYRYALSGKGKAVLTWTFDNIMLPDSTSNEPGSHGYIQFSIKPKANLPEKTAVENFADISSTSTLRCVPTSP